MSETCKECGQLIPDSHTVKSFDEMEECMECHCIFNSNDSHNFGYGDWEYKDFTNKTVLICPQCKTEYSEDPDVED